MMIYGLISLFTISLSLFIASFFQRDRFKQLEEQLEALTMNVLQSNYQMKRKLEVIEEEFFVEEADAISLVRAADKKDLAELPTYDGDSSVEEQIDTLIRRGKTLEEISHIIQLPQQEVLFMANRRNKVK